MFIKRLFKLHLALILISVFANQATAQTTLRFASWAPPSHPQNSIVLPTWAKWVETATEGRVKVEIEYGLGHPKTMFDLVEDGVADAGWSYHGYVPGRFKLTQIVELPMLGTNAEAASVAYWRIFEKYLAKANEHDGLIVLGVFTHGPAQIHTIKPINSLSDLKNKKIRLGGGVQAKIGEHLGITGVAAPATKVYEMLQQRIIDGVFISMGDQKFLRLKEVTPYITAFPGGMYLGSFSMFINPDFLNQLDERDRSAILAVSGEKLSAMAGRAWDEGDIEGLKAAQSAGVTINNVSIEDPLYKEFRALTTGMDQEFLSSIAAKEINADAALNELRFIARNYQRESH